MSRYVRSAHMVGREFLGEYLLVPLVGKTAQLTSIFATNELGAFVWKQLEQPTSIDSLVRSIVEVYEASNEQAAQDCTLFLTQLESVGAVERMTS
jgi:Coenzyme PQQ synthesis protein D (PqqD)